MPSAAAPTLNLPARPLSSGSLNTQPSSARISQSRTLWSD